MVNLQSDAARTYIELLPNRSASWKQMMALISVVAVISLGIAVFWVVQGAWVVMPFTLLELSLLLWVVFRVSSDSSIREVVTISDDVVKVEKGRRAPEQCWDFSRKETSVEIVNARHSLSPPQVKIKSAEQKVIIGEKLNIADVNKLIACLKSAHIPLSRVGDTHIHAIDGFDL